MPMNVEQIRTIDSNAAVQRIKSAIRKDGLGFSFDIPKEFIEKRIYMQSDEFLKDADNIKMFGLLEKFIDLRDKIAEEVAEKNKTSKDVIVQGINGFSRIKKYLDANFKMNFSDMQTFHTPAENKYNLLKKYRIGNLAKEIKNSVNK